MAGIRDRERERGVRAKAVSNISRSHIEVSKGGRSIRVRRFCDMIVVRAPNFADLVAWDHDLYRALIGVFVRAVLGWLRGRAHVEQGVSGGRSGAVAIIQRFGAALNVNVHTHALVLDGVFADDGTGTLVFHPVLPPDSEALDVLLTTIARRIERLLIRRGV